MKGEPHRFITLPNAYLHPILEADHDRMFHSLPYPHTYTALSCDSGMRTVQFDTIELLTRSRSMDVGVSRLRGRKICFRRLNSTPYYPPHELRILSISPHRDPSSLIV